MCMYIHVCAYAHTLPIFSFRCDMKHRFPFLFTKYIFFFWLVPVEFGWKLSSEICNGNVQKI